MNSSQPALLRELLNDQRWLVTISRRLLARGDDAEDVAQEASVRALEARAGRRVVPVEEARPWLIQTVRRLAWNANRREAVRASVPFEDQLDLDQAAPVDALARAEFRKVVAALVMDLPEVERKTLILRFYEDMSTAQIMEATGAPSKDAVRQRLSRGVRRLREQLDGRDDATDWRHAALAISSAASVKSAASATGPIALTLLALGSVAVGGWLVLGSGDDGLGPRAPLLAAAPGVDRLELDGLRGMEMSLPRANALAPSSGASGPGASEEVVITIRDHATGSGIPDQPWFVLRTGEHDYGGAWSFSGELPNPEPIAEGITDSMGVLRFHARGETLVNLCAARTESHAQGSWAIRVRDGEGVPGAVSLGEGTTFSGRVVDDLGEPCQGVVVATRTYSDEWVRLGVTDAEGAFDVGRCADFPRSFVIREDGAVEPTRTLRTELVFVPSADFGRLDADSRAGVHMKLAARGRQAVPVGEVVLPRGVTLRGRVWGSDGRPVPGATVSRGTSSVATTDQDGRYVLSLPARSGAAVTELHATSPGEGEATLELTGMFPGTVLDGNDLRLDGLKPLEVRWVDPLGTTSSSVPVAERGQLARILWDVTGDPLRRGRRSEAAEWAAEATATVDGGRVLVPGSQLPDPTLFAGALRGTLVVPGWAPAAFRVPAAVEQIVVPMERLPEAHIQVSVKGDGAHHFQYAKVTITAQPPSSGLTPKEVARQLAAGQGMSTVAHEWKNHEMRALPLTAGSGFYIYVTLFGGTARAPKVLPARGPIALASATAEAPYEFEVSVARWPERQRLDQAALGSGQSVAVTARRPTMVTARVVDAITGEFLHGALMRSVDSRHQHRSFQRAWKGEERQLRLESSLDQITLRFVCTGYEPLDMGPIALAPGDEVRLGEVALKPLRRVPCRVLDQNGARVRGVRRLSWKDPVAGWTNLLTSESGDAEIFAGVEPPKVVVVGDVQGSSSPPQRVRTQWNEAGECVLVVQPWRHVRLRVQGLDLEWRRGLGEVVVEAQGPPVVDRHRRASFTSPRTDGQDVVFDMDLPPGTWMVRPVAPEFVAFPSVAVEVPRGSAAEPIEIATRAQLGSEVAR